MYAVFTGRNRTGLAQRISLYPARLNTETHSVRVWIHAASVGEVQAARVLVDEIRRQFADPYIIVTTVTEQGHRVARAQLGAEVEAYYAPIDLVGIVNRAVKSIKPDIYVCLETELWPALIRCLHNSRKSVVLLNGRMSQGSFARYMKIRGLMMAVLARFAALAVIQPVDRERYIALGAAPSRVHVLGNAKYDTAIALDRHKKEQGYRQLLGLEANTPVFIAGSTHSGEEAMMVDVFCRLASQIPGLVMLVAPRHLNRLDEIERLFAARNLDFKRFSGLQNERRQANVVLVDTMGELAGLYAIATYVFCGGSLVERGGHNIMEAAIHGLPVFYGPSMKDFDDARMLLESVNAGFMVQGSNELAERILQFYENPAEYEAAGRRAGEICQEQVGSAARQVRLLLDLLHESNT